MESRSYEIYRSLSAEGPLLSIHEIGWDICLRELIDWGGGIFLCPPAHLHCSFIGILSLLTWTSKLRGGWSSRLEERNCRVTGEHSNDLELVRGPADYHGYSPHSSSVPAQQQPIRVCSYCTILPSFFPGQWEGEGEKSGIATVYILFRKGEAKRRGGKAEREESRDQRASGWVGDWGGLLKTGRPVQSQYFC